MASYKKKLEKIIRKIQQEKNLKRTEAIWIIVSSYDISYATFYNALKHSRNPKDKKPAEALDKIIADYS